MNIGSHNSWSYLQAKKWWMRIIAFTAKCQQTDIYDQYLKYNVRCFDLRVRFDMTETPIICHGPVEYDYTPYQLYSDLEWLRKQKDVIIRLLLDLRGVAKESWPYQRKCFNKFYNQTLKPYGVKFILGRELPSWEKCLVDIPDGSVSEKYASVTRPKLIDDWFPWLYARLNNHKIIKAGTVKEILLIDFVNIK